MPQCVAFGCYHATGKSDNPKGLSFHRFPHTKPELLQRWLQNIGRKHFIANSNSRLCSEHFLPDCFVEDKYAKYGLLAEGKPAKRLLKDDAVPTEFTHRQTERPKRLSTIARLAKKERKMTVQKILAKDPEIRQSEAGLPVPQEQAGYTRAKKRKAPAAATLASLGLEPEPMSVIPEAIEPLASTSQGTEAQSASILSTRAYGTPRRVYGTPRRTLRDHSYFAKSSRTFGTQTSGVAPVFVETTRKSPPKAESPAESEEEPESPQSLLSEEYAEYLPIDSTSTESETTDEESSSDPSNMKKYIVFEDNLQALFKFCGQCGSPVTESSKFTSGSMIGFKLSCHNGHSYVWHSQPQEHKRPVGNLLLTAATLVSGSTYAKMNTFAEMLNLQFLSKTLYNKLQKHNILPVIQEAWEQEQRSSLEEAKAMGPVILAGDGRCDSPGHTAKYGSYTLMLSNGSGKSNTNKIVSTKLVQVSEVKNSNHMEPEGLRRCLKEVTDNGLQIETLATDRHIMVTSMMKKDYSEINHQFDVWHLAKGVVKKLTAKAKVKGCENISSWIQSISNHLWWCSSTCGEDDQTLREKWLSLLQHVQDKHKWSGNTKFHKCDHPQLSSDDKKLTLWLEPKSPSFLALQKIVMDTRLLNSLKNVTKFCHTGELEVFHSMLLKYCPKRQHFFYEAMAGRMMLAALDWNSSRRQQKTDKSGKPATSVVYSKRRKLYVLKNRYGKIKSPHMQQLMSRIYVVHKDSLALRLMDRPEGLPQTVSTVPKPEKAELQRRFKSRFK